MEKDNHPDYSSLIDSETFAFIERTEQWYPPDTVELSIQRQREIYDAMCREFYQGHPSGVKTENSVLKSETHSIGLRRYVNSKKMNASLVIVIYFHGGGFVVGGLDSHDDVCAEICKRTEFDVVSVDYRLAPEHDHPAAFQDSLAAVKAIAESTSQPLILCGDSAGGNLAAAVAHAVRNDELNLAGQLLIYPSLGAKASGGSFVTHANAPMLTTRDVMCYLDIRRGETRTDNDPTFAPLRDTDFKDLPATVVFSAECDPLCDDGKHYAAAVVEAGGNAHWVLEAGLVHGYLRARSSVTRARGSFSRIIESLIMLGNREWFY